MVDVVEEDLPDLRTKKCKSCGASIIWLRSRSGSNMIVDAETVARDDHQYDAKKHRAHWATCKDAATWRKPR